MNTYSPVSCCYCSSCSAGAFGRSTPRHSVPSSLRYQLSHSHFFLMVAKGLLYSGIAPTFKEERRKREGDSQIHLSYLFGKVKSPQKTSVYTSVLVIHRCGITNSSSLQISGKTTTITTRILQGINQIKTKLEIISFYGSGMP